MEDIDEHLAFLSRRFAKLKFKKNFGAAKPNRNMVDKSKFKCFKCGLAGHFASVESLIPAKRSLSLLITNRNILSCSSKRKGLLLHRKMTGQLMD